MLGAKTEKCLKITCYILQAVCFITGAAMLGLGIWAVVDKYLTKIIDGVMFAGMYILIVAGAIMVLLTIIGVLAIFKESKPLVVIAQNCRTRQIVRSKLILIVAGAIMVLLTIIGVLAIFKESKPLVVIYCIIALLAILLKVIGCIIIFDYFVTSHFQLRNSYKHQYGNDTHFEGITEIWDEMQSKGECCGLLKYWDWEESEFYRMNGTYPASCCVLNEDGTEKHLNDCQRGRKEYIHVEELKTPLGDNGQLQFDFETDTPKPQICFTNVDAEQMLVVLQCRMDNICSHPPSSNMPNACQGLDRTIGCEWVLERYYYGIGGTAVGIIIIELFAVVMIACLYQYFP